MTLKNDGNQNSLTTLLAGAVSLATRLSDHYQLITAPDGRLRIIDSEFQSDLDPGIYNHWMIGLNELKKAGVSLDNAKVWSAQASFGYDEASVTKVWGSLPTYQTTAQNCPHVEQSKQHTIKDLIKLGILTPHLAMRALSYHPALNDQPEWAELVVGELDGVTDAVRQLQRMIHGLNRHAGWWNDLKTGEPKERNDGELLMLMVSELAEGMEGVRKNLMDDKLPHRKMIEVELADCLIRILDYAGGRGLDVAGAMIEKLAFNSVREDHTIAARQADDGKKF
jgi:NTP pyrophosphatase (non-canonical NTP hydrolase)